MGSGKPDSLLISNGDEKTVRITSLSWDLLNPFESKEKVLGVRPLSVMEGTHSLPILSPVLLMCLTLGRCIDVLRSPYFQRTLYTARVKSFFYARRVPVRGLLPVRTVSVNITLETRVFHSPSWVTCPEQKIMIRDYFFGPEEPLYR